MQVSLLSPKDTLSPWSGTHKTRVRGGTKDSRKAGSASQTESPGIQDSGKEEGQEYPPQDKGPAITRELELGHCYLC